ncbi:pirin family protein [Burkholderia ubonensis]|uniref:Uncharacterized protein n=1 Tax=Burkholderia ubonensis subsp. mesacidophila TaxID=265293 RepID=A0A2A4FI49_9BURK|nr:pirin-like C-terminal cupin domain-containing protein [Burkholderia ubonensis]PCE32362.1 hypothetical protein BZL54_10910 [Burkholderia ubonensis subsp. mesacidophila]
MLKPVLGVFSCAHPHRDAAGQVVRTFFSERTLGRYLRPFTRLDHVTQVRAPYDAPASARAPDDGAGAGATVSILHRCAAQSSDDARDGQPTDVATPPAEIVRLAVDDARAIDAAPHGSRVLHAEHAPAVALPGAGEIRVIAGSHRGRIGPVPAPARVDVWELELPSRAAVPVRSEANAPLAIAVLRGRLLINGDQEVSASHLVVLARAGTTAHIESLAPSTLVLIRGAPSVPAARDGAINRLDKPRKRPSLKQPLPRHPRKRSAP